MNRFMSVSLLKQTKKYFPDMAILERHKFLNFISVSATENNWRLIKSYDNYDYMFSKNLLRAHFKQHIFDWIGIDSLIRDI